MEKRGRGRPKGSKNKVKKNAEVKEVVAKVEEVADIKDVQDDILLDTDAPTEEGEEDKE